MLVEIVPQKERARVWEERELVYEKAKIIGQQLRCRRW